MSTARLALRGALDETSTHLCEAMIPLFGASSEGRCGQEQEGQGERAPRGRNRWLVLLGSSHHGDPRGEMCARWRGCEKIDFCLLFQVVVAELFGRPHGGQTSDLAPQMVHRQPDQSPWSLN